MDEALKRRLIGALILILAVFIISLLLPRPGVVHTDENNQRVTLDLTGNTPEPVVAAPTPVPPVIAATPTPVENGADNTTDNANTAPEIEEPPLPAATPAAPVVTQSAPTVEPAKPAAVKPVPAPAPEKTEVVTSESPRDLKLEESLKQKPIPAPEKPKTKPVEKTPPKAVAKVPAPVTPKVEPKPATTVAAKPATATPAKSRWYVQLGAFNDIDKAHQLLDKLKAKGLKGIISPLDSEKGTLYRARLGAYPTQDQAKQAQASAAKLGYTGTVIGD
ncbi:MAG: SPOR domain-containing protein [Pseudomonadota bacterium]